MALWKARGVNTAVGYEHQSNTVSLDDWNSAANGEGLLRSAHPMWTWQRTSKIRISLP